MASEESTSLRRAIDVLNTLGSAAATAGTELGVGQISRLLGREKTQVSRCLKTLATAGLVERNPETLGYRLGWKLFALAETAGDRRLTSMAHPVLRDLVARTGERAHLTVLQGDHVLTVLSEQSSAAIQVTDWLGRSSPVYSTSAGQALLLQHDDDQVHALLSGAPFAVSGPHGPRNVEDLLERLRHARARSYVVSDEEFETGLVAAAAPVRDPHRRIVGALNVSAPKFRLGKRLHAIGRQVKASADHLSHLLSHPQDPDAVPDVPQRVTPGS